MKKKWLVFIFFALLLSSCEKHESRDTIRIVASPTPHAELLNSLQAEAKELGIRLQILPVDDYRIPNRLLLDKQIDANYFQHQVFLEDECERYACKDKLAVIAKVHLEPQAIYSRKFSCLNSLKNQKKLTIAIPVDCTNAERALRLLEDCGIIVCKEPKNLNMTAKDVYGKENRVVNILEVSAPLLVGSLSDVDAAVIPGNFAIAANLSPRNDSLCLEDLFISKYTNLVVVRSEDLSSPKIIKLQKLFQSPSIKSFFDVKYRGDILTITQES
ncbi:Methionine-binding lipoprotein metQ precursor,DL-methionine transporter substrate-binding subunit,lipoprotein, YaeC family,NLPA lipoprotein [Chlamydia serpentis]|uniref:Methionine-binding lipoprotein metQ,DL-methionine transporter substrate-binding subunit,lipoprotein, YaeC family,NLPA lipoprotein n=1 Tax=Chlamydia serpentis TaxID=1967782 RepID=A0A2R8FAG5_9CHLA|nr:MetQ/NlpA family ABC transporter substrate-binding protein [Chlamydia serpentis]SPN73423.1 Methionine-binding lipoprotein metQ precursor,DL-methionine transporter substrate-binding subunit,lipoprotein, YaeC family,NLPA lipoprotein [Chlamydia serpentis]